MPLVHALVQRVADDRGIRVLAIKGPTLYRQGLRDPHVSIDVDVLVEPEQREALTSALAELGWTPQIESTTATIGGAHSSPLTHDSWPVEIDVHHRFPGFLADPVDVFEVLWSSRTTVHLAGAEITCTDRVASAAVAALHHLRRPDRGSAPLRELGRRVDATFDEAERARLRRLAETTGGTASLRPFLELLGLEAADRPVEAGWAEWRLLTTSGGQHAVAWTHELSRTPWRDRPAVLRRALLLTEPEIRHLYTDLPAGRRGLLIGRLRRLRLGLRSLPAALRTMRRIRTPRAQRRGSARES